MSGTGDSAGSGSGSGAAGTSGPGSSGTQATTQASFTFGVGSASSVAAGFVGAASTAPLTVNPGAFAFGAASAVGAAPMRPASPAGDPAATGAEESVETRYSRHLDLLLKYYARHDPSKTREQVVAIIAKRKGDAAAMDESLFVEVCGKLESKYGENPLGLVATAPQQSSASVVDPEMAELLQDDREEEHEEVERQQQQQRQQQQRHDEEQQYDEHDEEQEDEDKEDDEEENERSETTAKDEATRAAQEPLQAAQKADDADTASDTVDRHRQHGSSAVAAAGSPATHQPRVPVATAIPEIPAPSFGAMAPEQSSHAMAVEHSPVYPSSSTNEPADPMPVTEEARYSRHLDLLLKYYAKHDPSKTREQVVAIIAKRKGDAVAMDESLFVEVCGKLESKYGDNPLAPEKNETCTELSASENMDVEENFIEGAPQSMSIVSPTMSSATTSFAADATSNLVPAKAVASAAPTAPTAPTATVEPREGIRAMVDTEHDLHRVEQQLYRCKTESEKLVRLCAEQKRQLQDNDKELTLRSKTVAEENRSANAAKMAADELFAQKEALATENAQLRKALDDKAVAIQDRDRELEEFTARVVRTNALKAQAQDDHHEAEMKLQRARRDMSVAQEEAELARQQGRSSDSEVQRLNEELLNVWKEKSARERELQEELDKLRSVHDRHTPSKVDDSAETAERCKLQVRVRELEADAVKAKADAEAELRSQEKLTELYKEAQEDGDLKAAELQVMLAAKTDECEQQKRKHSEERSANETRMAQLEEQERAASQQVQALKQRIEEVQEFGDAAFSPPVTDKSGRKRRLDVSGLSESAALAQRYADVSSTVLASRYEKAQVELRKAKEESKTLQASLDDVLAELEKRAPTVAKVFEEQELMSNKYSELSTKMSEVAEQNEDLRKQLRDAEKFRVDAQQHREVLERETVGLRKQVGQLMTIPVQTGNKRRRGSRGQLTDKPQYRAAGTTLALPAPATAGGSTALVLQDVDGSELNAKQDLERKVIELQVQCETLQEANSESVLQAKLKECAAELEEVRGQRKHMEEIISSITRQRDSYMATLKAEIEGGVQKAKSPKPASPRKLPPPPSAEVQCLQTLASLQANYAKSRAKWSDRVDELQHRIDILSKRASSAEIAHAQQQAELEHAKLIASDYESQEKGMKQRLQLAQERAVESDGLVRDLRSRLDAAEADRSLAKAELARVTSSLESAERRYDATKSRESALQAQYEEQATAKNALSIALADALEARQRDSQARSQEASALQLKIDEAQEEKKNLEGKLQKEQDALETNRAALSSVSKARDSAEELVISLRASQDGLRQQCTQLSSKLSDAKAAAAMTLSTQNAKHGSTVGLTAEQAVNLDVANLQAELASSAEQIASLKQHIADYKQLVQHSEGQVKELQQSAQQQTSSQASATQLLSEAEARCKSLAAELEQAKQQVASSATALQEKEADVAAEQAAKGAADRRADQVQVQLVAKTAELEKATSALSELKSSSEDLNVEVARLQTLATQVEAARAEAAAAQGALSRTEAKGHEAVNAMEKKLDAAAAEMRDLRTQNEMLLGQLDRAMNSLATDSWAGGGGSSEASATGATDNDGNADMSAVVEGLREVVKSLRHGREMAEARLELVQQQAVRDKSQVQVLQRELTALRQQGAALAAPVDGSPRGALWTEKERAELVGSMAAAQETSAMVEELRAARNQLALQLQTANQAKNAAVSAKAVAEKAKEEAELASSRLQATLSVKEMEVKMWQTKLEKSTERTKIQQLMKDKKEALTTAKEVATKLENEKKIVKQWMAKHGAKDREATVQKAEAAKQKTEVIKLQSQVTKLQTEKAAAEASTSEKEKQLVVKSDEEVKTKADLAKTKELCKQLLEKVRSQTCPKCGGTAAATATAAGSAATTASDVGPDKAAPKAAAPAKSALTGAGAKPSAAIIAAAGASAAQAPAATVTTSPALGAAKFPATPALGAAGGAIAKGSGRATGAVKHNRGGGRAGARGAVLHKRGAAAPAVAEQTAAPAAASTVKSAAPTASGGLSGGLAGAPSLSAPATASSSGIGSGIGGVLKPGKLSATAPSFTFAQSSTTGASFVASPSTSSTSTSTSSSSSSSSSSGGAQFVFGKPPGGSGATPSFTFGNGKTQ